MSALHTDIHYQNDKKLSIALREKLSKIFITDRLNSFWGYAILTVMAVCISLTIAFAGVKLIALILGIFVGLPLVYAVVVYPKFGIMVLLITAYIIMMVGKFSDFPVGVF